MCATGIVCSSDEFTYVAGIVENRWLCQLLDPMEGAVCEWTQNQNYRRQSLFKNQKSKIDSSCFETGTEKDAGQLKVP